MIRCRKDPPGPFLEDRTDQFPVTLEHQLEGRQQRVGGGLREQRQFIAQARQETVIAFEAGQLAEDAVGKGLPRFSAEIDLGRLAPDGEEEQRRGQAFTQPIAIAGRVRPGEADDIVRIGLRLDRRKHPEHSRVERAYVLLSHERADADECVHRRAHFPDRAFELEGRVAITQEGANASFDFCARSAGGDLFDDFSVHVVRRVPSAREYGGQKILTFREPARLII